MKKKGWTILKTEAGLCYYEYATQNIIPELSIEGCVLLRQKRSLQLGTHLRWFWSGFCVATSGVMRFSCVVPFEPRTFYYPEEWVVTIKKMKERTRE